MEQISNWIAQNAEGIAIIQAFLISSSALAQWLGWVAVSKALGTLAAIDAGRVSRRIQDIWIAWRTRRAMREISKITGTSLVVLLLSGCAAFRGAVSGGQAVCNTVLAQTPEVIQEASIRGVKVSVLADLFCEMVDVAAVFSEENKPTAGARGAASPPREQAVALLKAKGEIR